MPPAATAAPTSSGNTATSIPPLQSSPSRTAPLGVVSNTRYNGRGYDVRLEVHGSKDSGAAGVDEKWPVRSLEPGVAFPSGEPHRFFMDRFQPAFQAEFETFIDVAAGKRPSPCTVADGLEADWIAEACARSLIEHRPVRIEEVRVT
jgi:myo-inositol 2-dehydrogenase/D-chiro-inositol 1-dehydrogenase